MTATAAKGRSGGLIDRRLVSRVAATRRYLMVAAAAGLLATVSVVAQAVLLATVVERSVVHGATLSAVTPQLAGLAAAFVARGLASWAGEAAARRCGATVVSVLRRQLLRHALELGPTWLAGERAGELSMAATRGTTALDTYFGRYLPQAILAGLAPVAILAWVGWQDWVSLLILLGLVALVPVAMIYFGRESSARTRRQWRRLASLSARFLELVQGLPTLRAFGRETQGRRDVAAATEGLRQTTMGTLRVAFLSALALEFLAGIGTGLVAMVLGLRLLDGTVSLYTALAVLLVSPEVFLPLRRAGTEFHASAEGQAAAERILGMLDEGIPSQVPSPAGQVAAGPAATSASWSASTSATGAGATTDGVSAETSRPVPASVPATATATATASVPGSARNGSRNGGLTPATAPVQLDRVTVRYPGRAAAAVEELDLTLEPGEHVALVGPSGAGKSTVVSLLLRFLLPDEGRLLLGGLDLAAVAPAEWRKHLAWVPQRPHLLHGTLGDNLRLGDPAASVDRLEHVVAQTGLGRLLAALPRRLDTPVGEGGVTLSAGERQRLAIARAVLRDAPLVILDEPVAHLDNETEAVLRSSLQPWLGNRTVLVAAHRPELVSRIDRVVTLPAAGDAVAASSIGVGAQPPAPAAERGPSASSLVTGGTDETDAGPAREPFERLP